LVPEGTSDILFPTDFGLLRLMYESVTGKRAMVEKHGGVFANFFFVSFAKLFRMLTACRFVALTVC
jgi:hypothetical protein